MDAEKPASSYDRLKIARGAVWLFTAGAIGVAAYFFVKSELASDYWKSGKDYVSTQLEVIKKDGFEHWARSTKPEALKREGSSDEADKSAESPDTAKTESAKDQASESESKPTAVAKAAAPAPAPAPAPEGEKSKPLAKAPPAAVAKIESGSKPEAVAALPDVPKKLAEDKSPVKALAPEAIEPAVTPAPALRGQPSATVLALSEDERTRLTKTISEIIAEWSFSWATQDFARYSSFYSRDFSSDRYATLSAWLKFRRSRIVGRQDIDVDVHDLRLIDVSNQAMMFDFVQRWSSGNRQIFSVKRMTMTQETPGWWSISRELATDLPANHPVVLEAMRLPAIKRGSVAETPVKKFNTSSLGQEKQDQAITESGAVESPATSIDPVGLSSPKDAVATVALESSSNAEPPAVLNATSNVLVAAEPSVPVAIDASTIRSSESNPLGANEVTPAQEKEVTLAHGLAVSPPPVQVPSDDPPVTISVQQPALEVSEIPADRVPENSAVGLPTLQSLLPETAPLSEPKTSVTGSDIKLPPPNEPTLLVTELVLLGSIRAFSKAEIFDWMGSLVGRNVSFPDLEKSVASITRNYRERGYVAATAIIPQQSFANGRVEVMVYEGDLDPNKPVRVEAKEGLRLNTEWASRIVKNAIGEEPIQQETLERGLLMLQEIPGVSATVDLEPGDTQGTVRAALIASEGKAVEGSVGVNNMGAKSTGEIVGSVEVRFNNPIGEGEQLGFTYKPSEKKGQESYSLIGSIPVGDYGLRLGLSANRVTYRVDTSDDTQASGLSDDITLSLRYPIQRSRAGNQSIAMDLTKKKMSDQVSQISVAEKGMSSIGFSYNADRTDLATGNSAFGALNLTSGRLDLTKNQGFFEQDQDPETGPKTHGAFFKALLSGGASIRLPYDSVFSLSASTQMASKNLSTSEKFGLGGPSGVRAYPVGEASGDEGWRLSAELRHSLITSTQWGTVGPMLFYDTGSITKYKRPDGLVEPDQQNSYRLSGWGLGVFASKPNTYDFKLMWAKKIGSNPGQREDPRDPTRFVDNDGTNDKSRLWATFTYSF